MAGESQVWRNCLACALFCIYGATGAHGAPASSESELPAITIEAVVKADSTRVTSLQWLTTKSLLVEARSSTSRQVGLYELNVDSAALGSIGEGTFASVSPSGHAIAYLRGGSWIVRDVERGNERQLLDSSYGTQYSIWPPSSPSWSAHGDYLAFSEVDWSNPKLDTSVVQTVDGVRVVDVGVGANSLRPAKSRIRIVDMRHRNLETEFELSGIVTRLSW